MSFIRTHYGLSLLLLLILGAASCAGILSWATVYSSRSLNGEAELRVQESGCFADCALRIIVKQGWSTTKIASASDCAVFFAHAAWKGSRVAVYVDGGYCGPVKAAYDTATGEKISFETLEIMLRSSIVNEYSVTTEELQAHGGDVLAWATYPGDGLSHRGPEEFRKRFKQGR